MTCSQKVQLKTKVKKKKESKNQSCTEKVTKPCLTKAAVMASEGLFWLQQTIFVWLIWTFPVTTSSSLVTCVVSPVLSQQACKQQKHVVAFRNQQKHWAEMIENMQYPSAEKKEKEGQRGNDVPKKGSSVCMIPSTIPGFLLGDCTAGYQQQLTMEREGATGLFLTSQQFSLAHYKAQVIK